MRGYSKIKENNPFFQRSKSKKEYPFLDHDFESRLDSNFATKNSHENEQKPNISDENYQKNDFFLGRSEEHDDDSDQKHQQQQKTGAVLRRNLTVSSTTTSSYSYQKNNKGEKLERQSSTRAIQEAVKRAFSMRRSSSVNNSDRYSRIYDQPINVEDRDDYNYDYVCDDGNYNYNNGNYNHQDDDFERDGSMETRSISSNKKNNKKDCNGKMHVRTKVVRACKRLFSR